MYVCMYIYIYRYRERGWKPAPPLWLDRMKVLRVAYFSVELSHTPNLPTNITPTNIAWLRLSGKFPMDMRIIPLRIKIMFESNSLKSTMLVGRLGVCNNYMTCHYPFSLLMFNYSVHNFRMLLQIRNIIILKPWNWHVNPEVLHRIFENSANRKDRKMVVRNICASSLVFRRRPASRYY